LISGVFAGLFTAPFALAPLTEGLLPTLLIGGSSELPAGGGAAAAAGSSGTTTVVTTSTAAGGGGIGAYEYYETHAEASAFEEETGVSLNTEGVSEDAGATEAESNTSANNKTNYEQRPSNFRVKTIRDNWDNAEDGSQPNTKKCPTCGNDVEGNPHLGEKRNGPNGWDVDHQPKWKEKRFWMNTTTILS
jgi:hypothetical protein